MNNESILALGLTRVVPFYNGPRFSFSLGVGRHLSGTGLSVGMFVLRIVICKPLVLDDRGAKIARRHTSTPQTNSGCKPEGPLVCIVKKRQPRKVSLVCRETIFAMETRYTWDHTWKDSIGIARLIKTICRRCSSEPTTCRCQSSFCLQ